MCLSPLFTFLMCCSFSPFHLGYKPSSVMSCFMILYPCTLYCCFTSKGVSTSQRRETRASPDSTALIYKAVPAVEDTLLYSYISFCKHRNNKQKLFCLPVFLAILGERLYRSEFYLVKIFGYEVIHS